MAVCTHTNYNTDLYYLIHYFIVSQKIAESDMSTHRHLKVYIANGLPSDIREFGYHPYEHTSLLDWIQSTGAVKLLIVDIDLRTHSKVTQGLE